MKNLIHLKPEIVYYGMDLVNFAFVFAVVVGTLIISANVLPLVALKITPSLRQHPTHILLGFMAAIDFACGFCLMYFLTDMRFLEYSQAACRFRAFLYGPPYMSGCMMITLSIDRLLAIRRPLWYKSHCGTKYSIFMGLSAVFYGQFVATLMTIYAEPHSEHLCLPATVVPELAYALISTVQIFVGFLVVIVLNISVLLVARRQARIICPEGRDRLKKEMKAYRLVLSLVAMYFVFYIPYIIFTPYITFTVLDLGKPGRTGGFLSSLLAYSNNVLNPLLYTLRLSSFRKPYKKILVGIWKFCSCRN